MADKDYRNDTLFLIKNVLKSYSGIHEKTVAEKLSMIRREKVTKPVIYVGSGSCGIISGALGTLTAIREYLKDQQVDAVVVETGCKGLSALEPMVDIQLPGKTRISFRNINAPMVNDLLSSVFNRTIHADMVVGQYRGADLESWPDVPFLDDIPFFSFQQRNLLAHAGIISPFFINDFIANGSYKALYKTLLNYPSEKVCEIIEQSGLRGRGGGGFPTGRKWKIALETAGDQKYMICNADESDPGAFTDRVIIENNPHGLIEGLAIASYAIGANQAYIYIRSESKRTVEILEYALKEAKEAGFLGENIFESGYNLNIHIRKSAGAFVCGEETALIGSLESNRGIPRAKPPYPAEKGLFGKPTVVNNVETLANVPQILEHGPAWFKKTGTPQSNGTKVFSISGKTGFSGFVEVAMGTPLSDILSKVVDEGDIARIKAIQIGGPIGMCIPPQHFNTTVDYEALAAIGVSMGAGGLIVLDDTVCMVDQARYFTGFLQRESCGKCIPCREGTRRMVEILDGITRRPREESTHETLERFKGVVHLENLAEVIRDTSLCGLGQNAVNPVLSCLKWFRDEFEEHIFDRRCRVSVCKNLRTFHIDVEHCNGCNICQKRCPENAIIGVIQNPHFIVEEKCNGCGICFDVCKFNAISYK